MVFRKRAQFFRLTRRGYEEFLGIAPQCRRSGMRTPSRNASDLTPNWRGLEVDSSIFARNYPLCAVADLWFAT